MIIYVDGSASTKDGGVHDALMDAVEVYLDDDNPSAVEVYGFNHDQVWPIRKRSDQKLHLGGATMEHVVEHAAGRDSIVITEDKFLEKMWNSKTPSSMAFEVVSVGFMHVKTPAPIPVAKKNTIFEMETYTVEKDLMDLLYKKYGKVKAQAPLTPVWSASNHDPFDYDPFSNDNEFDDYIDTPDDYEEEWNL